MKYLKTLSLTIKIAVLSVLLIWLCGLAPFFTSVVGHTVYSLMHDIPKIEAWSCYVHVDGTQSMVVAKYNDILNGYDVSFVYRTAYDTNWFVYYMNHESSRWRNVKIYNHSELLVIVKDTFFLGNTQCVALFDMEKERLWNNIRQHISSSYPFCSENENLYDGLWHTIQGENLK